MGTIATHVDGHPILIRTVGGPPASGGFEQTGLGSKVANAIDDAADVLPTVRSQLIAVAKYLVSVGHELAGSAKVSTVELSFNAAVSGEGTVVLFSGGVEAGITVTITVSVGKQ